MSTCSTAQLSLRRGTEFTSTAKRRSGPGGQTVVAIPAGWQARMRFAADYSTAAEFTLTSSPAAGLTINYPQGTIAIYIGATVVTALLLNAYVWELDIYDPLVPNSVVFLGSGTAIVKPAVQP